MPLAPDSIDSHVARWSQHWKDNDQFDPLVEGVFTRFSAILRRRDRKLAELFRDADITFEDFDTLHALVLQPYPGEATPAQLAEATHVTRGTMTTRLDRLVEGGYVTRENDSLDRRRVLVRPTKAGRAMWETYVNRGMAIEQGILAALEPKDAQRLESLLKKVTGGEDL